MHVYTWGMPLSTRGDAALKGTATQIAERIRSDIEEGLLAPGAALNQVDLAEAFGLSRIPIREALRQLEAQGYVNYRPNKGATVVEAPASADVVEIIELRECLEVRLMEHAARRMTPSLIREAEAALRALNAARTPAELRGAHERFHSILFAAANRPQMAATVNAWRFRLDERPDVDGTKRRAFAAAVAEIHAQLLRACKTRDRKAARRCVLEEYRYLRSIAPLLARP